MVSRGKLSLIGEDELAHVSVKCQAFNTSKHLCTHIHKERGREAKRKGVCLTEDPFATQLQRESVEALKAASVFIQGLHGNPETRHEAQLSYLPPQ